MHLDSAYYLGVFLVTMLELLGTSPSPFFVTLLRSRLLVPVLAFFEQGAFVFGRLSIQQWFEAWERDGCNGRGHLDQAQNVWEHMLALVNR